MTIVALGEEATERGERLADRIVAGSSASYVGNATEDVLVHSLLSLVHEDDTILREPVPPLSTLLPAPPERPYAGLGPGNVAPPGWRRLQLALPPRLFDDLAGAAAGSDMPLETWLADELERLTAWPTRPWRRENGWDDDVPPWLEDESPRHGEWPMSPVVPLDRFA